MDEGGDSGRFVMVVFVGMVGRESERALEGSNILFLLLV